jgi:hypothetical protein
MDGHPTEVVFFAQILGKGRVKQSLKTFVRSLEITIQGVAWIDSDNYHIIRMPTERLEPYLTSTLWKKRRSRGLRKCASKVRLKRSGCLRKSPSRCTGMARCSRIATSIPTSSCFAWIRPRRRDDKGAPH